MFEDFLNNIGNLFSSVYGTSHVKSKLIATLIAVVLFPIVKKFIITHKKIHTILIFLRTYS